MVWSKKNRHIFDFEQNFLIPRGTGRVKTKGEKNGLCEGWITI
jgi:hypothetical protein